MKEMLKKRFMALGIGVLLVGGAFGLSACSNDEPVNSITVDGESYSAADINGLIESNSDLMEDNKGLRVQINGMNTTITELSEMQDDLKEFRNNPLIADLKEDQKAYDIILEYVEEDNDFEDDLYDFLETELSIEDDEDFDFNLKNFNYDTVDEFYELVEVDDREEGDYVVSGRLKVNWDYLDEGEWREDREYVDFEIEIRDWEIEDTDFSL